MMIKKSGMITICGRPNVGKSTLTNALVGGKVAIVTPKPQTTRNRICAVLNRDDTQFVFMDTPGFHKPRTALGEYMVRVVRESVADVDAVLLLVPPEAKIGAQESALLARIREEGVPCVLAVNKIDTIKKEELFKIIELYAPEYDFGAIVPISARSGDGVEELLSELSTFIPDGPPLFPEGMTSDQPERRIISEIVREKLLLALDREVPHGVAVEIERMEERDDGLIEMNIAIYCEKNSHKGIIIGKNGAMLKKVSADARADIERFLGAKVFMEMWVRVKENWRANSYQLRNFGYE